MATDSHASTHFNKVTDQVRSILPAEDFRQLRNSVLPTILNSVHRISQALHNAPTVSQVGTANAFGDDQLNVDVLAEKIVRDEMAKCEAIVAASSEEDPTERAVGKSSSASSAEHYAIAFDPLDGSSIIAPNWTVGTIVGVWQGDSALNQNPDENLCAAVLGVYGPRTTAIVAIRSPAGSTTAATSGKCFEVGFDEHGACEIVNPHMELLRPPFKTRYFAPANLRAAAEDEQYAALINHYIQGKYTLRYSGGLVPDIVHALVKGHGIYVSPVTSASKAKLRRLYELTPVALIVECAGGNAVDPSTGQRILAEPVRDTDERGGLVCGTREEVDHVKEALATK